MNVLHIKIETFSSMSEVAHSPRKITGRCFQLVKQQTCTLSVRGIRVTVVTSVCRFFRGAVFRGPRTCNLHFSLGLEFVVHQRLFDCCDSQYWAAF